MFKYGDTIENYYSNFDMKKISLIVDLEDHLYGYEVKRTKLFSSIYTNPNFLLFVENSKIDGNPIFKYNVRKIKIHKLLNETI